MQRLFQSGRSLKRAGTLLFILGGLLIVGPWAYSHASSFTSRTWKRTKPQASAWISNAVTSFKNSTQSTPQASAPLQPPPVTLAEAKRTIPGVLKDIYTALNEGNPQLVARHLHTEILKNSKGLDFICQPFNYRAHYIDSIVERPNQWFLVRVRTLFKPSHERSYLMTFGFWNGHFYLHYGEDDPFSSEKNAAVAIARKFIFAVRAGEWDLVRRLSSPDLDVNEFNGADWQRALSRISGVEIEEGDVQVVSNFGIKLKVKPKFSTFWMLSGSQIQVDPADPDMRVVHFVLDEWGNKNQVTAANLEQQTLLRFGISQNRTHPAVSSDTSSPEERQ